MRFAPAVAVALRATLRAAKLHPHCASHREAATRFACANIQNSRRACGGFSLTIPCSSSHFVHTSGGNRSQPTQCMPHLWRSHRRQIREHNVAVGRYVIMPDHVHSFRPRTRRFSTRAMGRNAETSSRETYCAGRDIADLAARLFRSCSPQR